MTFPVTVAALGRRELGGARLLLPPVWAVVGIGAALLAGRMRGLPVGFTASFVANFEIGLSAILAAFAAFRIMLRSGEDHSTGWIVDWCGSGGRREHYILALGAVVTTAALIAYGAGVGAYAITRWLNGAPTALADASFEAIRGVGRIASIAAYGMIFAATGARPGITFPAALALFVASPLVVLFAVVMGDLPEAPQWARLTVLHLPPINAAGTSGLIVRQFAYVLVACSIASFVAGRRVGTVS